MSEDADPALGLGEDLRLKLLSVLQGMGTDEEEPRKEPAKAESPAACVQACSSKPAAPKPAAPKPAPVKQVQPAEAAGERGYRSRAED